VFWIFPSRPCVGRFSKVAGHEIHDLPALVAGDATVALDDYERPTCTERFPDAFHVNPD
jgi:hypothetical protein